MVTGVEAKTWKRRTLRSLHYESTVMYMNMTPPEAGGKEAGPLQ
jgi:hypothetical protein